MFFLHAYIVIGEVDLPFLNRQIKILNGYALCHQSAGGDYMEKRVALFFAGGVFIGFEKFAIIRPLGQLTPRFFPVGGPVQTGGDGVKSAGQLRYLKTARVFALKPFRESNPPGGRNHSLAPSLSL